MKTPSFVVLGAGSIGRRHMRNLISCGVPPQNIRAVDLSDAQLDHVRAMGVVADHVSPRDRVSDVIGRSGPPSAMLICVPAVQHEMFVSVAISAAIPFFVEKPATLDPHALINWQTTVPHVVGCNMRFRQDVRAFRRYAKFSGAGHVATFTSTQDMSRWPGTGYVGELWEFIHEVDLAIWCFGEARLLSATRDEVSVGRFSWRLELEHVSGVQSTVTTGHSDVPVRSATLRGLNTTDYAWQASDWLEPAVNTMYRDEMVHFLEVLGGWRSRCTLSDARHAIAICKHAEISVGIGA